MSNRRSPTVELPEPEREDEDVQAPHVDTGSKEQRSLRVHAVVVQLVEILLLAVASMVWAALIAVVIVALASTQPVRSRAISGMSTPHANDGMIGRLARGRPKQHRVSLCGG